MTPLNQLPWIVESANEVQSTLARGRLGHAVLATGAAGIGLEQLGPILAKTILCEQASNGVEHCGCRSCVLLDAGNHPDFLTVSRETDAGVIKIKQIRELIDFLQITSHYGKRVVVVNEVDTLNLNGANALLKTLEEPVNNAFLIVLSEQPQRLLPTIQSRCQRLVVRNPSREESDALFLGHDGVDLNEYIRTRYSDRPIQLLQWIEDGSVDQLKQWIDVLAVEARANIDVLKSAMTFAKVDPKLLVNWWVDYVTWLASQERPNNAIGIHEFYQLLLAEKHRIVSGSNPNFQLVLEHMLANWYKMVKIRS